MANLLPISCCYILRNEDEFLKASIDSVVSWVSELVFVDSGSTDRTQEIAKSFQSKTPNFQWKDRPWTDDFSEARNEAARLARHSWIMFVDGDEILEADAFLKITRAISQSKIDCYSFIQRNYSFQLGLEEARRAQAWPPGLPVSDRPLFYIENWMERLYRKGLGLCYEGRIHESLIPACERLHREYSRLPVVLHHYGRLKKPDPSKLHYYLELTEKKCREESQNPVPWIELCINLMEVGALEKAFSKAEEAVGKFSNQPEILRVGFQAALRTERFVLAEQWIRDFLKQRPRDLYAKAQLTTALLYQRKFPEVFSLAEEIFREEPSNFVAHLNCGVISFEEKNWKDAARHLEAASRERPDDVFVRDSLKKVMSEIQKD